MEDRNPKTPEFLQIKGYKYRAKMLAAAAVILVIFIIIIVSVIHSIATSLSKGKNSDTDSEINTGSSVSEKLSDDSDSNYDSISNEPNKPKSQSDAFNGEILEIDTDNFDGKKVVAITFDDGPGEYTKTLIEELNRRNVKATFFMLGSCVEQYPEVLPLMVSGGHQLGNHTYNHTDITSISLEEMNDQISRTDDAIYNACGQKSTAFRPPYGSCNDSTNNAIDKTITLWSVDTVDWNLGSADDVKNTIVSQCKDGDIILLHDIYESTVYGAIDAIDELLKQGFVFVTVDELLERYGYEIEKGMPHTSQYAVYETNSPHAQEYLNEINSQKAMADSTSATNTFYSESSNAPVNSNREPKDNDTISVINNDTDSEKRWLVY